MSSGYLEIGSQRPMCMPSSETLMISPFAAKPGMPSVTRKEAFSMSRLRSKGCSPKLGRQQMRQNWPGGVRTFHDTIRGLNSTHSRPLIPCSATGKRLLHPKGDVAAAGGWKDTVSLKRAYQQADADTILSVVLNGGELREEQA